MLNCLLHSIGGSGINAQPYSWVEKYSTAASNKFLQNRG